MEKKTRNNTNSCNNNFKYCFDKHLIVLIIVECRLSLVQSVAWASGSIIILSLS